jgi:hypothetical protein
MCWLEPDELHRSRLVRRRWVIPGLLTCDTTSSRARLLAEYFAIVVVDATANLDEEPTVRCRRRPGRRPCTGIVMSYPGADEFDRIYWYCPLCSGNGFNSGWQNTLWVGFAENAKAC